MRLQRLSPRLQCLPQTSIRRALCSPIRTAFASSSLSSNFYSTQTQAQVQTLQSDEANTALSPRWLSDAKARLGKCIMFGMSTAQVQRAGKICNILGKEWRELVAGSEGFLTDQRHAGLLRHNVVWGEMDFMQHVNNVTYTRYAESARINWAFNFATHIDPANKGKWSELWTPNGDGLILKSITTDYKFPMTWPDKVSVFHKLRHFPDASESSFILDVMILSEKEQRPAARCVEDIVVYDYKKGKKVQLRTFMLDAFEKTFILQEEAKSRNTQRVRGILGEIRRLEKETWDRADAKEDFGSAT